MVRNIYEGVEVKESDAVVDVGGCWIYREDWLCRRVIMGLVLAEVTLFSKRECGVQANASTNNQTQFDG